MGGKGGKEGKAVERIWKGISMLEESGKGALLSMPFPNCVNLMNLEGGISVMDAICQSPTLGWSVNLAGLRRSSHGGSALNLKGCDSMKTSPPDPAGCPPPPLGLPWPWQTGGKAMPRHLCKVLPSSLKNRNVFALFMTACALLLPTSRSTGRAKHLYGAPNLTRPYKLPE